jgi:hypothetical protein
MFGPALRAKHGTQRDGFGVIASTYGGLLRAKCKWIAGSVGFGSRPELGGENRCRKPVRGGANRRKHGRHAQNWCGTRGRFTGSFRTGEARRTHVLKTRNVGN